ncbi:hypothetical protein ERO13_A03G187000v2 [Gossypium hirsutum]|uniref:Elicitor-responsive protein 1 isoform X2 n=1 Tax=Gossypium hirsutum TaxID=3635 RepID=A0A1U8M870_GOSHI|nr:elicitor-responsive protein 1 isoform X2 [Gossypium hirsutum]KAG4209278.1 hypothetical protein ERO13_A03G187000v2 [Gossypium hirsutum]
MSGIQGQILDVTVVGCKKLKDTEWLSKQDPYVCLEYANTKYRTKTCTDGGKSPIFQEKFTFSLLEGLTEVNVVVWNSNTLSSDDLIGYGRIQLQKAISQGYDDSSWAIQTKTGRFAGEVQLILHYPNAKHQASGGYSQPSAPPAYAPPPHQPPPYGGPPVPAPYPPPGPAGYPAPPYPGGYPQQPLYPPATYPLGPDPYGGYPRPPGAYPPPPYYPPGNIIGHILDYLLTLII